MKTLWLRSVLAMALSSIAALSVAQTAQKPAFEAATIKPSKPDSPVWARCHVPGKQPPPRPARAGCLMTGVTVKMVMGMAYLTFPYKIDEEIAGGPNWAGSDRFDIETKTDNPAVTEALLAEMLQQLLSDRFKLTFHREPKEISGYRLVVAKNGPKLRAVTDPEAHTLIGGNPSGGLMSFQTPIIALADYLSARLGKRVQDQTGLTGKYQFTLTWTPAENEVVPPGTPPRGAPPNASASLITAIQEQLGLKLESAKVPSPVLVIDSVQRPTEN
jgi:uncharacterized protein (TIGR03435 family)